MLCHCEKRRGFFRREVSRMRAVPRLDHSPFIRYSDGMKTKQPLPASDPEAARRHWEESMLHRLEELRQKVRGTSPAQLARAAGGSLQDGTIRLPYWERTIVCLPDRGELSSADGSPLSTFDQAMVLFHLCTTDGSKPAGSWISFRDLPGGVFYNQAFQGYSGALLAQRFALDPPAFARAAVSLSGKPAEEISSSAWRFLPFPNLPLAAVLWPGDDELPGQAQVLFDTSASGKMVIDGLALLGAQLARRLLIASPS